MVENGNFKNVIFPRENERKSPIEGLLTDYSFGDPNGGPFNKHTLYKTVTITLCLKNGFKDQKGFMTAYT